MLTRVIASAAVLVALAGWSHPLSGQSAGEVRIGLALNAGPRLGLTVTTTAFVRDQVGAHCGLSVGGELVAYGCGASVFAGNDSPVFLKLDLGRTDLYGYRPPEAAGTPPLRSHFLALAVGAQLNSHRITEVRPYLAVGPALVTGPLGELSAEIFGLPAVGGWLQPTLIAEAGVDLVVRRP